MTSGDLVTMVNSSGGFLAEPMAWRKLEQAPRATAATNTTPAIFAALTLNLILLPDCRLPVRGFALRPHKGVKEKRYDADRNGRVSYVENIPVAAEGVKVEKIRYRAVKYAVDHISERPSND